MEDSHFEVLKSLVLATRNEIIATIAPVVRDQAELKEQIMRVEGRVDGLESERDQRAGSDKIKTGVVGIGGIAIGASLQFLGNLLSGVWHPHL